MINYILISSNNNLFYGVITKDINNKIIYDIVASVNYYGNCPPRIFSMKYNYNNINYLLDDIKNKNVYFITKDEYKIKKLKDITLSKSKLNMLNSSFVIK